MVEEITYLEITVKLALTLSSDNALKYIITCLMYLLEFNLMLCKPWKDGGKWRRVSSIEFNVYRVVAILTNRTVNIEFMIHLYCVMHKWYAQPIQANTKKINHPDVLSMLSACLEFEQTFNLILLTHHNEDNTRENMIHSQLLLIRTIHKTCKSAYHIQFKWNYKQ